MSSEPRPDLEPPSAPPVSAESQAERLARARAVLQDITRRLRLRAEASAAAWGPPGPHAPVPEGRSDGAVYGADGRPGLVERQPDSVREPPVGYAAGTGRGTVASTPAVRPTGPDWPALPLLPPAATHTRDPVPPETPLRQLEFAVLDFETTGGSAYLGHRVTEVGVVCLRASGELVGELETLVNPGRSIPPRISRLTNISDEMVSAAPSFRLVAAALARALEGRVVVAHNAGFDLRYLGIEMLRATGRPYDRQGLCTVRLTRRLVPELGRRSLDAACTYFGIPIEGRHRALGDARATARLLLRLLERAEERCLHTWGLLEATLARPGRRRRRRSALPRSMDWA